jgi:hypothetical protein
VGRKRGLCFCFLGIEISSYQALLTASSCSQSSHYEVYNKRTLILSSLDRVYSFSFIRFNKNSNEGRVQLITKGL